MEIQKRCKYCGRSFIAHKMTTVSLSNNLLIENDSLRKEVESLKETLKAKDEALKAKDDLIQAKTDYIEALKALSPSK